MAEISWTLLARKDLRHIYNHISKDSVFYAQRFTSRLVEAVEILQNFPNSGRVVPEKNDPAIRELIEGNYRIFYQLRKDGSISVLRIHHAARLIK